jgi:hypothetical protein
VNVSVHGAEHFEALHGTRNRNTAACKHKRTHETSDSRITEWVENSECKSMHLLKRVPLFQEHTNTLIIKFTRFTFHTGPKGATCQSRAKDGRSATCNCDRLYSFKHPKVRLKKFCPVLLSEVTLKFEVM